MRLTALNPRWVAPYNMSHSTFRCGVSFDCPHCGERLMVFFKPAISSRPPLQPVETWLEGRFWDRTGETFEDLTLTPSLDFSASGHFHGFITGGEVT